jgi:D-beta-D-heptose 7-phosphate kinase/D-beta-D-heptose 1-phosphate adenosyltransferase
MTEDPRLLRDKADLRRLADRLRAEGKTIATVNGCFDLLHSGHIRILTEAAKQGDVLIVGLNSDSSVRAIKPHGRPVLGENERAAILLALEPVDYVFIFQEPQCMDFIAEVRPDVHVNDASYGVNCIESQTVREVGARLHLVPKKEGHSTSNIVGRMRAPQEKR